MNHETASQARDPSENLSIELIKKVVQPLISAKAKNTEKK